MIPYLHYCCDEPCFFCCTAKLHIFSFRFILQWCLEWCLQSNPLLAHFGPPPNKRINSSPFIQTRDSFLHTKGWSRQSSGIVLTITIYTSLASYESGQMALKRICVWNVLLFLHSGGKMVYIDFFFTDFGFWIRRKTEQNKLFYSIIVGFVGAFVAK